MSPPHLDIYMLLSRSLRSVDNRASFPGRERRRSKKQEIEGKSCAGRNCSPGVKGAHRDEVHVQVHDYFLIAAVAPIKKRKKEKKYRLRQDFTTIRVGYLFWLSAVPNQVKVLAARRTSKRKDHSPGELGRTPKANNKLEAHHPVLVRVFLHRT